MTFQQQGATIAQGYADDFSGREGSLSTTSPQGFIFLAGQDVAECQAAPQESGSPASMLGAYRERVVTGPASALFEGGAGSGTVARAFSLPESQTAGIQRSPDVSSRRERYARLIALVESWLADTSGYDEEVWPRLKERIEQSRTSARKRFSD